MPPSRNLSHCFRLTTGARTTETTPTWRPTRLSDSRVDNEGKRKMAKKKNSRKVLAVVLGVAGIAGISMASASTLTVTPSTSNIAVGTGTFAAACDDAVAVSYTYDAATLKYTSIVVSGILPACSGKTLTYKLNTSGATDPAGTVVLTAATSTTIDLTASNVPLSNSLDTVDLVIS